MKKVVAKKKPAAKKPVAKKKPVAPTKAQRVSSLKGKKPAAKKPAAKKPAAKKPAAKKPASKPVAKKPKPAKSTTTLDTVPAGAATADTTTVETATAETATIDTATHETATSDSRARSTRPAVEELGRVTCPSGTIAIFDVGLVGYLPRAALEPAMIKVSVPSDRPLTVTGTRVGTGRFADCWDHVTIDLGNGDIYNTRKLGEVGCDFARIICMDHRAFDHWKHDESLDGLADVVFWGRDEAQLARALRAPKNKDGYGWTDLSIDDAEAKIFEAEILKADNRWLLDVDFRPHSHHFHALAAARANPSGAGAMTLADSELLLFFTSWGDGVFPIYLDLDHDDRPVRIRIQLASEESAAATRSVN